MAIEAIERDFKKKVCSQLQLVPGGLDRYRVSTPFMFDDCDRLVIVLKKEAGIWTLSDEGHTFMRLSLDIDEADLRSGTRQTIIEKALSMFRVSDREGELVLPVPDEQFGDALYDFVQALLRISDVTLLSREQVRSTFKEDFHRFMAQMMPSVELQFNWHDPLRDPKSLYPVDCRIDAPRPLFVYALSSDDAVRDATLSLTTFRTWGIPFRSIGIFEDQEAISRRTLARYTNVAGRQYSGLRGHELEISQLILDEIESSGPVQVKTSTQGGGN